MMQKTKRKAAPQNFVQYFFNEYLFFRREFSYEIHVDSEILIKQLRALHYNNNSWWRRERRITPSVYPHGDEIQFEILAEQPGKNGRYSQTAKATGTIFQDDDGVLFMEGEIVMGTWLQWFMLIGVTIFFGLIFWQFLAVNSGGEPNLYSLLFLFMLVIAWLQMYFDRNHLAKLIQEAVNSANERLYG